MNLEEVVVLLDPFQIQDEEHELQQNDHDELVLLLHSSELSDGLQENQGDHQVGHYLDVVAEHLVVVEILHVLGHDVLLELLSDESRATEHDEEEGEHFEEEEVNTESKVVADLEGIRQVEALAVE